MTPKLQLIAALCSAGFLVLVFELVRRRALKESYALTWFFVGGVALVFSLLGERAEYLTRLAGFSLTSNAIIVFFIFLLLVLLLGLSIAVSRLSGLVQTLTQEIGLLKNRREKEGE